MDVRVLQTRPRPLEVVVDIEEESNEMAIVEVANAIIDPWTVVICKGKLTKCLTAELCWYTPIRKTQLGQVSELLHFSTLNNSHTVYIVYNGAHVVACKTHRFDRTLALWSIS